jgi:hypothetical protein
VFPYLAIDIPNLGHFATLFFGIFVTYAILKYELFTFDAALATENSLHNARFANPRGHEGKNTQSKQEPSEFLRIPRKRVEGRINNQTMRRRRTMLEHFERISGKESNQQS